MKRLLIPVLLAACQPPDPAPHYDVLLRGGMVYDGTLTDGARTDIGVRNGRIASTDTAADATADTLIDATGMLVMPGFIDPHTHARRTLADPRTNANVNYLTQGVTTVFIGNDGYGVPDREKTLGLFERQGIGTNVAVLAGHGAIRKRVMGLEDRHATSEEIAAMQAILAAEMQEGAFGLSTGLFYAPGSYADTREVIELAKTAAQHGGIYDTHLRSESSHADGLLAAIDEAIAIAREARIGVHISHLKALGKDMWGQGDAIIARVEAARAEGLDVTANQYPWRASGTRFSNALVPRWVMADSTERMRARLADPELGPRIREELARNLELRGGPDAMLVTAADSPWRGRTLSDIATAMETDLVSAAIAVIVDGDPSIASFVMHPDVINALAVQPWVMTGSDGSSGHPRLYGTYPKAWADLVESGKLSIPRFVHRSSGLVAETFGLCDRGFIREAAIADIIVVDGARFRSNATYEAPTELSEGIAYLLINGVIVIDDNRYDGALAGRVLDAKNCHDGT